MTVDALPAVIALNQRYLLDFPQEAARRLETMTAPDIGELFAGQPPHAVVRAWEALAPDVARAVVQCVPEALGRYLLAEAELREWLEFIELLCEECFPSEWPL